MKILHGNPELGSKLTKSQIIDFLINTKLNMHLGTIDHNNEPNIHPVWFLYANNIFYIETSITSIKIKNILKNKIVYFCIDTTEFPYMGIRGKGIPKISSNIKHNTCITKKILIKYVSNLNKPISKLLLNKVQNGLSIILEIVPKYYSTWNNDISL